MEMNKIYDIYYNIAFIAVLTIMKRHPRQQITKVFQTTCINAIKENNRSMFSEKEMTLLCFSISIPNDDIEDP